VLAQPYFFESTVTPFDPHLSSSYDAAYGASLVSRRMGLDLLERCTNNYGFVQDALAAVMDERLPSFSQCRDLCSLRLPGVWGPFFKFILVLPMSEAFPNLVRPRPTVVSAQASSATAITIATSTVAVPLPVAHTGTQTPTSIPPAPIPGATPSFPACHNSTPSITLQQEARRPEIVTQHRLLAVSLVAIQGPPVMV